MDDLNQKIANVLNNPESLETIKSIAAMMGNSEQKEPSGDNAALPFDMDMLMKLAPMLSSFQGEDERTQLLKALRPHLGAERQQRVDNAIKILQFAKVLPLIKDSGIL